MDSRSRTIIGTVTLGPSAVARATADRLLLGFGIFLVMFQARRGLKTQQLDIMLGFHGGIGASQDV
jgi:hypothetical protein